MQRTYSRIRYPSQHPETSTHSCDSSTISTTHGISYFFEQEKTRGEAANLTATLVEQVQEGDVVAPLVGRTPDQALHHLLCALQVFRAPKLFI